MPTGGGEDVQELQGYGGNGEVHSSTASASLEVMSGEGFLNPSEAPPNRTSSLKKVTKIHFEERASREVAQQQAGSSRKLSRSESSKRASLLNRTNTEKLKFGETVHPLYLSIDNKWRRRWDVLQAFILLYTCIMVPIRVGYGKQYEALFYLDLGIDLYFTIDVYLNFVTGYEDEDGDTVTDMRLIAKNYVQTWFLLDLLAILPIELILDGTEGRLLCNFTGDECPDGNQDASMLKMFKVLRLLRLMKLLRLMRLSRLLDRYDDELFLIKPLISIFKLISILLFLGHLFGCFFYYFSSEEWRDETEKKMISQDLMSSWIETEFGGSEDSFKETVAEPCTDPYVPTNVTNKDNVTIIMCKSPYTLADRYIASMYWAFTTMTTVGYGDISATTKPERVFAILGMIVGGFVFSIIIGNMGTMLRKLESHRKAYNEKMDSVSVFLRDITLPTSLRNRVLQFFRKQDVKSYDPKAILLELPFELRSGVLLNLYSDIIKDLPFLQKDNEMFVTDVCSRLQPYTCARGTFVFQRGELGGEMFIIYRGEVEVIDLDRQTVLFKLEKGEYFGEANVVRVMTGQVAITSKPKRTENVRARTTAQLLVLTLADLLELTRTYPDMAAALYTSYKEKKRRHGFSKQTSLAKQGLSAIQRMITVKSGGGGGGGVGLQMLQTFAKFRRIVRERHEEIAEVLANYREAIAENEEQRLGSMAGMAASPSRSGRASSVSTYGAVGGSVSSTSMVRPASSANYQSKFSSDVANAPAVPETLASRGSFSMGPAKRTLNTLERRAMNNILLDIRELKARQEGMEVIVDAIRAKVEKDLMAGKIASAGASQRICDLLGARGGAGGAGGAAPGAGLEGGSAAAEGAGGGGRMDSRRSNASLQEELDGVVAIEPGPLITSRASDQEGTNTRPDADAEREPSDEPSEDSSGQQGGGAPGSSGDIS